MRQWMDVENFAGADSINRVVVIEGVVHLISQIHKTSIKKWTFCWVSSHWHQLIIFYYYSIIPTVVLYPMNSLTATAPIRAAIPKSYMHIATRNYSNVIAMNGLRCSGSLVANRHQTAGKRFISTTPKSQIKEFFPPPTAPHVKEVETAWVHPV